MPKPSIQNKQNSEETPEKDIYLRTEEVSEILGSTPSWIFRWGISVIFILILLGIGLSYLIKYPDILTAEITLTTLNPPVKLVCRTNGKIKNLLVKNNENVKSNEVIAVIENTADFKNVLLLEWEVISLYDSLKLADSLPFIRIKDSLKVGELTPNYLLVIKAAKDLNLYKYVNPYNRQINLLKNDLLSYTELLQKYKKQETIFKEQLSLIDTDFNRDKTLYESKAISSREFDTKKREYLSALNSYESVKITVSNALIQINSIEKSILQLQIQNYQEHSKLKTELLQNIKSLLSEIDKWKQTYLVISPIEGKLSYFNIWAINQNIKNNDELFSIVPSKKQVYIGKCQLPITNTGKLAVGQNVNIKLDNYPYNEFGILNGMVTNISEVTDKDKYILDIELKNGLVTSYNRPLNYKEEMKGKADIITSNLSIIDRIFFNFKKMINFK